MNTKFKFINTKLPYLCFVHFFQDNSPFLQEQLVLSRRTHKRFLGSVAVKTCNCKLQPNRQSYDATWRIQTRGWVDLSQRFRVLPN